MSNVVVFGNQKGGVGKSTLAVLYAFWLADFRGESVCFVDLDTQANASRTLRSFGCTGDSVNLFDEPGGAPQISAPQTQGRRLVLVPASKGLANVELASPQAVIPAFKKSMLLLQRTFDTVVIDTPPSLGLRMSGALIAATHVVCPLELEEYSLDGVTDMLKTIYGTRQRYNPGLEFAGLLLNRFNAHSLRQKTAVRELATNYADMVVPGKVSTRSAIPEALAVGKPVWELSKSSARDAAIELKNTFTALQQRISPMHGEAVGAAA